MIVFSERKKCFERFRGVEIDVVYFIEGENVIEKFEEVEDDVVYFWENSIDEEKFSCVIYFSVEVKRIEMLISIMNDVDCFSIEKKDEKLFKDIGYDVVNFNKKK